MGQKYAVSIHSLTKLSLTMDHGTESTIHPKHIHLQTHVVDFQ